MLMKRLREARGDRDSGQYYYDASRITWGSIDELEVDGWGRRMAYRCPGPVHRNGWDLYSFGPNGKDDDGGGDDILVGEDVAAVTSLR